MTLQPRHVVLATLLHVALFSALLLSGVQCSPHIEPTPVVQGVLISPSDLRKLMTPAPLTPPKPVPEPDQGPQPIVSNADTVADQAKIERQKQEERQQKLEQQKQAEQQRKVEAAKQEELRQQQIAQQTSQEQAQVQAKQQEEAKRKAEAAATAAAEQQRKQAEEQMRKEAQEEQQKQAALEAKRKAAEQAQKDAAERKRREAELQKSLGVESAQLNQQIQNEWGLQLKAAITQAWARPPGTDQNLKASLKIRLSPTGEVQNAEIAASSGVPLFDQTLKQAVYKASPLPLPRDPSVFDPVVVICFSPNPRNCE